MSRFDYVAYDQLSQSLQSSFKAKMSDIENLVEKNLTSPRAKALILTNLEVVYMWIGKAIRDDQIARNGSAPLQEGRGNE